MAITTRTPARVGVFGTLGALTVGFALMVAPGCNSEDPCDEYVEYLCDCDEASCESQRNTYADADSKWVQNPTAHQPNLYRHPHLPTVGPHWLSTRR